MPCDDLYRDLARDYEAMGYGEDESVLMARRRLRELHGRATPIDCPACGGSGLGPRVFEDEGLRFEGGLRGQCPCCRGAGVVT